MTEEKVSHTDEKGGGVPFRSGYVAISGRPNVGKSTLLNALVGQKVSIVTDKAQTTRDRVTGILTQKDVQIIFVDTPGLHRPRHGLGEHMVREARQALRDVDAVLYMVEPRLPSEEDRAIIRLLKATNKPVIVLINKIDTVKKPRLLPVIEAYGALQGFQEIIPVSALGREGLGDVVKAVTALLPSGPMYYPEDMVTTAVERSMVAEIIREKVMRLTREEVPHSVAVEVMGWQEPEKGKISIDADIYVEKEGQKGIIIGKRGELLKRIGSEARAEAEELLGRGVFLNLFVKVREKWRTTKSILSEMGYE